MTSRRRKQSRRQEHQRLGLAWYSHDQWSRLRELAADAAVLEDTYEEWHSFAERTEADLLAKGIQVQRVAVDVEEIAAWCTSHGRSLDGDARAEFVAELMRKRAVDS